MSIDQFVPEKDFGSFQQHLWQHSYSNNPSLIRANTYCTMPLDKYLVTQSAYNEVAEDYAANAFVKQWMRGYVEEFCALVRKPGKLLDLGCGPGQDVALFVERGFAVVGVDFSEKMLAEARKRVPKATFVCSDFRDMDFDDDEFDAVWSVGSLHHLAKSDVPGVFQKLHRCLKPGGYMFISVQSDEVQSDEGEAIIAREQIGVGQVTKKFWSYWQPEDFVRELKQANFLVIRQTHTESMRKKELPETIKSEWWINVWCRKGER